MGGAPRPDTQFRHDVSNLPGAINSLKHSGNEQLVTNDWVRIPIFSQKERRGTTIYCGVEKISLQALVLVEMNASAFIVGFVTGQNIAEDFTPVACGGERLTFAVKELRERQVS